MKLKLLLTCMTTFFTEGTIIASKIEFAKRFLLQNEQNIIGSGLIGLGTFFLAKSYTELEKQLTRQKGYTKTIGV